LPYLIISTRDDQTLFIARHLRISSC